MEKHFFTFDNCFIIWDKDISKKCVLYHAGTEVMLEPRQKSILWYLLKNNGNECTVEEIHRYLIDELSQDFIKTSFSKVWDNKKNKRKPKSEKYHGSSKSYDKVYKYLEDLYNGNDSKEGTPTIVDIHNAFENTFGDVDVTIRNAIRIVRKHIDSLPKTQYLKGNNPYAIIAKEVSGFFRTYPVDTVSMFRDECLSIISSFDNTNIQVITGTHGVGKTVLAYQIQRVAIEKNAFDQVIFVTYTNSLRETIASIPKYVHLGNIDSFDENIYLIREAQKRGRTLLIIDNYDNNQCYRDELSRESEVYSELLNTNCCILLTSTIDLASCYNISSKRVFDLDLHPFTIEKLTELFKENCNINYDETLIRKLILECNFNTYLVVLSSHLSKRMHINDILSAFKGQKVRDLTENIEATNNGVSCGFDTLYNLFCTVFEKHPLIQSTEYEAIFANLSLLPIEGIQKNTFLDLVTNKENQHSFAIQLDELRKQHLVIGNTNIIRLHSVFIEYLKKKICEKDLVHIRSYYDNLKKKMFHETYQSDLPEVLRLGTSFEKSILKICGIKFLDYYFFSALASCYDCIQERMLAYYYAYKSLVLMDKIHSEKLIDQEKLIIAICYNSNGYVVLQRRVDEKTEEYSENLERALSALNAALSIEESINEPELHEHCHTLKAKIYGNFGALEIKRHDYKKALEKHTDALQERLALCNGTRKTQMIATIYRCIATDYFYLHKSADPSEMLYQSFDFHRKSEDLFLAIGNDTELAKTYNRMNGTLLTLYGINNDFAVLSNKDHLSFSAVVEMIAKNNDATIEFLENAIVTFLDETENCMGNSLKILELFSEFLSPNQKHRIYQLAERVLAEEGHNKTTVEYATKIVGLPIDRKKT